MLPHLRGFRTKLREQSIVGICVVASCIANVAHTQATFNDFHRNKRLPVTTWKEMRDARLVKQGWDLSCGAASHSHHPDRALRHTSY